METLSPDIVETITRRLVDEFDPDRIYLFGSHDWGKPTPDSDIDLLVIVHRVDAPQVQRSARARRCLGELRISKDIFVKTRKEFNHFGVLEWSLEGQILKHGKLLYERPEN